MNQSSSLATLQTLAHFQLRNFALVTGNLKTMQNNWYNHRWETIQAIQTKIAQWTDPENFAIGLFPLLIKNIYFYWREPKQLADTEMPALFYRYGAARENPDIAAASNLEGETITLIITAVVNAQVTETDGNWDIEKTALQCATEIHLMLERFVHNNQHIGGTGPEGLHRTLALRLRRMNPENEKLSDREILEFHIEIDQLYPF